ncbi:MAG: aldo/keto reductase [Prevotellaceae bacterium]|jgi:alcohol dehydrogenase (NADP+)|nr:aldo/keto reductase [Prevotellaceae bacterium]
MKTFEFANGDKMPVLGLGTWLSGKNEVFGAVLDAIKVGYRHFDCAYVYANEHEIGDAIQEAVGLGWVKRDELFITSKLWNSFHAPEHVEQAIAKSLSDLRLDYLDLYLIHWPIAFRHGFDEVTDTNHLVSLTDCPLSETWDAMIALKRKGLAKHVGVSNFSISKIEDLKRKSKMIPEVNQIEIHPYMQQDELIDYCHRNAIIPTAYSPLGSSHIFENQVGVMNERIVLEIAQKHACRPSQVVLAWGMERDTVVIPKSVHPGRIKENFNATHIHLDAEDMDAMKRLNKNIRHATGDFGVFRGGYYTLENIWE